ncbi:MAG: hypothetical protein GY842_05290, partial [bacterium]|nr:hypothetical protein [bacterium]
DTGYPLINDSPVGDPDNPAPAVPTSTMLVDRVDYGRGGRSGHTDKWGYWVDETDGISRTTVYERDAAGQVTLKTLPNGDCVAYTYDLWGNVLTRERLAAEQCTVSLTQRRAATAPTQGQLWTYSYEPRFDQVKTATDPLGRTTAYVYDYEEDVGQAGNLIRVEYPPVVDGSLVVTPTVHYGYNAWGLPEIETDERGTVTRYTYTQGTPDEASDG